MAKTSSVHGVGMALVASAAVAWSTAPLFVRLLPFDSFTILFWRGVFAGGAICVFLGVVQGRSGLRDLIRISRGGLLFAILSAIGMVLFIPSLQLTSVANVAIILTTAPFAAAALAWLWFREIPRRRTVIASAIAVVGTAIAVGGGSVFSDLKGILLSVVMMLAIRRDDRCRAALSRYPVGRSCCAVEFPGKRRQPAVCTRPVERIGGPPDHPGHVRCPPGRAGPDVVRPRRSALAVGASCLDRDTGNPAHAVLGLACFQRRADRRAAIRWCDRVGGGDC